MRAIHTLMCIFLKLLLDRGHVDRRTILDNLELVMLTIDELVDAGTILETDSQAIVSRVLMRGVSGSQVCEGVPLHLSTDDVHPGGRDCPLHHKRDCATMYFRGE
jgi:hypothetical protein